MLRRQYLKTTALLFFSAAAVEVTDLFSSLQESHVCEIQIEFPEGHSFAEFIEKRKKWMKTSDFDKIIERFVDKGVLKKIDRSVTSKKIRISYYFLDSNSHDQFVDLINRENTVSDHHLEQQGYTFSRKYYKA